MELENGQTEAAVCIIDELVLEVGQSRLGVSGKELSNAKVCK